MMKEIQESKEIKKIKMKKTQRNGNKKIKFEGNKAETKRDKTMEN